MSSLQDSVNKSLVKLFYDSYKDVFGRTLNSGVSKYTATKSEIGGIIAAQTYYDDIESNFLKAYDPRRYFRRSSIYSKHPTKSNGETRKKPSRGSGGRPALGLSDSGFTMKLKVTTGDDGVSFKFGVFSNYKPDNKFFGKGDAFNTEYKGAVYPGSGLYMIENMDKWVSKGSLWKKIDKTIVDQRKSTARVQELIDSGQEKSVNALNAKVEENFKSKFKNNIESIVVDELVRQGILKFN